MMLETSEQQPESAAELLSYFLVDLKTILQPEPQNNKEKAIKAVFKKFTEDNPLKENSVVSLVKLRRQFLELQTYLDKPENKMSTGIMGFGALTDTALGIAIKRILTLAVERWTVLSFLDAQKNQSDAQTKRNETLQSENQALVAKNQNLTAAKEVAQNQLDYIQLLFRTGAIVVDMEKVSIEQLGFDPRPLLKNTPENDNVSAREITEIVDVVEDINTSRQNIPSNNNLSVTKATLAINVSEPTTVVQKMAKIIELPERCQIKNVRSENENLRSWGDKYPVDYYKLKLANVFSMDLNVLVYDLGEICSMPTYQGVVNERTSPDAPTGADKILIMKMIEAALDLVMQPNVYNQKTQKERLNQISVCGKNAVSAPLKNLRAKIHSYEDYNDALPDNTVKYRYDTIKGICREGKPYFPKNLAWVDKAKEYLELENTTDAIHVASMLGSAN